MLFVILVLYIIGIAFILLSVLVQRLKDYLRNMLYIPLAVLL